MTEFLTQMSPFELASVYARFYAQDFAEDVLHHLKGTYPLSDEAIKTYVAQAFDKEFAQTPLVLRNTDTIGQFLLECATYALEHEEGDLETREVWDQIKMLPSVHHQELQETVFTSARYYQKMFKGVLIDVLGQDTMVALKTIASIAKTRLASEETGGTLHYFNWGILNNGMWLNGALLKAYDLASIFNPGDPVVNYYATTAFDFARMKAELKPLDTDEQMHAGAELNLLISHIDEEDWESTQISEEEIKTLLFDLGNLRYQIDCWSLGINDIKYILQYLPKMSDYAKALLLLLDSIRMVEDDTLVSESLLERLSQAYDALTLCLVGYEALRETRYQESFLLGVLPQGSDMLVDVYVNDDLIPAFRAAGGDDANLIYFGNYFDPRKGMIIPSQGWSLSYILNRQVAIVSEMMAQTQDRLEALRANDAAFIEHHATDVLMNLVRSVTTAANQEMTPDLKQNVLAIARMLSNIQEALNPFHQLLIVLAKATGDKAVVDMAMCLSLCDDPVKALTMIAVKDAVNYITTSTVEE